MPRLQKPENTKHRDGDFMYYTYYHEFKTKDGQIVYHKNCCKKRITPRRDKQIKTPRMIKKEKERLVRELKKKLLGAVDSLSLLDLHKIVELVDNNPLLFAERLTNEDSENNSTYSEHCEDSEHCEHCENNSDSECCDENEDIEDLRSRL